MDSGAWAFDPELKIELLGPIAVTRGGVIQTLPRSRKTRALLTYLALQKRPSRREELCDLLWEGAADPKGELRWSLAKLRAVLGPYLVTSNMQVSIMGPGIHIDGQDFVERARAACSEAEVERALSMWHGGALADVDVEGQPTFQNWLAMTREYYVAARRSMLKHSVDRQSMQPEDALHAARRLVALEPLDVWGHARVAQLLRWCGREQESGAYLAAASERLRRDLGLTQQELQALSPAPLEATQAHPPHAGYGRAKRSIAVESMRLISRTAMTPALGAGIQATLTEALLQQNDLELRDDSDWHGHLTDLRAPDFAIRGTVTHLGEGVFVSLRCVNVVRGVIVWAAQTRCPVRGTGKLQTWLRHAIERVRSTIHGASLEATAADLRRMRTMEAIALAGALDQSANQRALRMARELSSHDEALPEALAVAAWCHAQRAVYNWSSAADRDRSEARRLASTAALTSGSMDTPQCLTVLAASRMLIGDMNEAEMLLERALHLSPAAPGVRIRSGWLANYLDRPAHAVRHFQAAMREAPLHPASFNALAGLGAAHFIRSDYPRAIRYMEQALALNPKATWILRNLIPAYIGVGASKRAEDALQVLLQSYPDLSVTEVTGAMVFSSDVMRAIARGLLEAGLQA